MDNGIAMHWDSFEAAEHLRGKTALVTGGTDGVGKEIARGLARSGYEVMVVGRDAEKGIRAERELTDTGPGKVTFLRADLSLVRETHRLAEKVAARWPRLNCLVHSAGVVRGRYQLTAEGIESNFAINYLSRFALSTALLPLLQAAGRPGKSARILIVGGAAQNGSIHFDNVNLTTKFSMLRVIGQFCQANDVFTVAFARRLAEEDENPRVTITSLKLGVVKTNIRREFPLWMKLLVPLIFDPFLGQTPQQAAASALRLLLANEFEGVTGALFLKIKRFKQFIPGASVLDPNIGRRLWELSERLAGGAPKPVSANRH